MNQAFMLSQVIAMIKASFDTKAVLSSGGDIWWREPENIDTESSHSFSIKWKRGRCCGSEEMSLYFSLEDIRAKYNRKQALLEMDKEYVFHIYLFRGDNCNDRTQFLYWLMGNQIDIIDDLGLCSLVYKNPSRKRLDKINPFDVSAVLSYQAYPNNKADPIKEKEVLGLEKLDIEKSNES